MLFLNYKKGTQRDVSTFYFIYSINRKMIRPVCGPFTHLGCEGGYTLLIDPRKGHPP